ncbi:MAG TPA: Maf family protein [Bryobacteraceae bacterium]|nr:Maf family protein [Bryobacteraceae bacterium]
MLVLASKSPRRQQILRDAGIPFVVRSPDVHEERAPQESAVDYVRRLAQEKAHAVALESDDVILGADTVVVVGGQVLEKPLDSRDAMRMLRALSGREHEVVTGICLRSESRTIVDSAVTRVHFVELTPAEIESYAASGEPMDKAGAYAIQGLASKFIDRVDGCYFNVVGLPVALVYRYWKELLQSSVRGTL